MSKENLMLIDDIVDELGLEGIFLTSNSVRTRLKNAMLLLAKESCFAVGASLDKDELERVAGSRDFQSAIASILHDEDP